jgi:hypothetical protein
MLEGMTPPKSKTIYCKIADMSAKLSDEDGAIFMEAIDSPELWGANTLSIQLRQRGLSVADTTITKHRSKTCACYRD